MKKVSEIQTEIFNQTGLKTTVGRGTGSMKKYITLIPQFQNGNYPDFPVDWLRTYKKQFVQHDGVEPLCSVSSIHLPAASFEYDPIRYKKDAKPKPIEEQKARTWGSKNSQLRLDKAAARYAKALRRGENRARYY
jgi:hypothetical protein